MFLQVFVDDAGSFLVNEKHRKLRPVLQPCKAVRDLEKHCNSVGCNRAGEQQLLSVSLKEAQTIFSNKFYTL